MWLLITAVVILTLLSGLSIALLYRATQKLFEFDNIFQRIIDPMKLYREELNKIATAEGLLHDHPEVIAFHRANARMLQNIEAAIAEVIQTRPTKKDKVKGRRPEFV